MADPVEKVNFFNWQIQSSTSEAPAICAALTSADLAKWAGQVEAEFARVKASFDEKLAVVFEAAAQIAGAPEVDSEPARAAAARVHRAAAASSLTAPRTVAFGELPTVEEAAHSAHNSNHSESHSSSRSEPRSQQQSQRITAAPNAGRGKPPRLRNQLPVVVYIVYRSPRWRIRLSSSLV